MRLLKLLIWSGVALFCGLLLSLSGAFLYITPNLPSVDTLRQVQLQIPLRVYSQDGKLIAEFGEMRRSPINFEDIPKNFIHALLAAEDDNFANHYGVDPTSLMRAATQLLKSGQIQTGGSTITMQVAKNFFLTSERSFSRKINEILLALQIERELSKDEILELYVNKIYLGNRAYGIEAAAQIYFGKSINELSLAQMAMIAGLPKAPSRFNPIANPQRSKERRDWILGRMLKLGHIDQAAYDAAIVEEVNARYHLASPELTAPYVAEMARAEMVARYGSDAYTAGFRVTTTVPSELQTAANQAVKDGLMAYDKRHGYRGPEKRLGNASRDTLLADIRKIPTMNGLQAAAVTQVEPSGIMVLLRDGTEQVISWESMKWARPFLHTNSLGPNPRRPADVVAIGDVIRTQQDEKQQWLFAQVPNAQAALVSMTPESGAILALVGGFSFEKSNYNRATQAKRQPGSSFKPFIYSAALDSGYTAASLVNDAPIVFQEAGMSEAWRPKNDNNTFLGPIRLREALYKSRNLVSIRLLQDLGMKPTLDYITQFGFERSSLTPNLSLALGTADLTPLEINTGWAVFANTGYRVTPYLIERIESRDGETLYQATPAKAPSSAPQAQTSTEQDESNTIAPQVIDERTAYIMTSMLQDVIVRGTGRRAMSLGRHDLAGKTGTTNDSKDSWFSGYNGEIVTTVWAGFDQPASLGRHEYGGTVALPIWISFMGAALKDRPEYLPPEPKGIVTLRVDPFSGRLASPDSPGAYFEVFKAEDAPPPMSELSPGYGIPNSPLPLNEESAPLDLF